VSKEARKREKLDEVSKRGIRMCEITTSCLKRVMSDASANWKPHRIEQTKKKPEATLSRPPEAIKKTCPASLFPSLFSQGDN
jgi:hypothetical protein